MVDYLERRTMMMTLPSYLHPIPFPTHPSIPTSLLHRTPTPLPPTTHPTPTPLLHHIPLTLFPNTHFTSIPQSPILSLPPTLIPFTPTSHPTHYHLHLWYIIHHFPYTHYTQHHYVTPYTHFFDTHCTFCRYPIQAYLLHPLQTPNSPPPTHSIHPRWLVSLLANLQEY